MPVVAEITVVVFAGCHLYRGSVADFTVAHFQFLFFGSGTDTISLLILLLLLFL